MVESSAQDLDAVFHALAHPARRDILRRLAQDTHSVTELAAPYAMSLEAVSKHIQVLERANLLRRTRAGRVHRCALRPETLAGATQVLEELKLIWNDKLDALEAVLEAMETEE